ncbi:DUF4330 family protein [Haloplanus aerogenes]|uniref:DUF4330 family protein n=1 Tax=Haloplanus aerogenes TaxID=660522 RepID=A0A3M0DPI8_9EURY|nr:DUF4330 family protein [Haloplanus aerogenes]AZH24771.1 DUF4330 family protein [Haloplanus aerogenes]RMB23564.1 uncharacterized protein DUF4330 [Haloplanus aerogenes]
MSLIDDDGNLFGVINVIDALVVLFVLAVIAAGAAFLLQPADSGPDRSSTHVTLELGTQPDYLIAAINEGDTYSPNGNTQLTVTDVHLTPADDGTRVIVRAELQGPMTEGGVVYADAPPRLGRSLDIRTNRYVVSGQIRAIGERDTLAVDTATVVLRDTMPASDAREVAVGDEIRIAGRTVATINDVAAYATGNTTERMVFVEATLQTHQEQGQAQFGGTPLRRGQVVPLPTEDYMYNGRVERVGEGFGRGSEDVLLETVVDVETANRIAEGDVATVAGHRTAEVESVMTYATQNPDRKRVFVGVSLRTLGYGEREQFGSTPIQRGNTISLEAESYQLSSSIERVGAVEPRGTSTTRTVVLRMNEVREEFAESIRPGMTERANGKTIARITDVNVDPSLIITTGQNGSVNVVDHPINRDVMITAELRVRETTSGIRFKGQSIRQRSQIVIDLGTITIEATVISA